MIRRALTSGILLALLTASPASAIVVAYDGFDYPNSSPLLHNRAGGFGWTEGWMDNDQDYNDTLTQDDTSIMSAAFPFTPVGDRLSIPHVGEAIRSMGANFNMTQDGVTFFGSLLMNKTVDIGTANEAVEFRLISNLSGTEAFRLGFGSTELLFMDSGAVSTSGTETLVIGDPYFFVFKIVSSAAGNDEFYASVFGPTDTVPATEPVTWDVSHTEAVNHIYNGVRFQTGSSVAGSEYDEIRIGQTWADVAVGTSFILGDFNNSGGIDPGDLASLVNGLYVGGSYAEGDIDLNGIVDLRDYNIFRPIFLNAGFSADIGPAVPEPAAYVLFVLGMIGLSIRRRYRGL
jgi:hypothetical protein